MKNALELVLWLIEQFEVYSLYFHKSPLYILVLKQHVLDTLSHYNDVIMGPTASQITSSTIVFSTVYSDADQSHQSSASLAFVCGIHRWLVNSLHKWPVTRKRFPFDDVIMYFMYEPGQYANCMSLVPFASHTCVHSGPKAGMCVCV